MADLKVVGLPPVDAAVGAGTDPLRRAFVHSELRCPYSHLPEGSTRILNRVHDASGRLPLAAAGRMTGDAPSFGGLGDEAAAGDEVRGSDDSDEMVAAAAGLVLPSTAGACAHHELTSRVGTWRVRADHM